MRTLVTVLLAALMLIGFIIGRGKVKAAETQDNEHVVVRTKDGQVRGLVSQKDGIAVFRGIPYASPPVGGLRWRPPAPVPPWDGVLEATRFAPRCPQGGVLSGFRDRLVRRLGGEASEAPETVETSEDCLYLNVTTPNLDAGASLPVMVWIHGGGFRAGSGDIDGSFLASRGAIVVSMNYRIGALGFMAHPALSAESPHGVSGNYGLLDQIEALRWVQRNIAAFGGDPANVTIFGISGGGTSIRYLMQSPLSKGLFHRAILQSTGSGLDRYGPPDLASAGSKGERLTQNLGVGPGPDLLRVLRGISPDRILAAQEGAGPFRPVVDGWVLPESTRQSFGSGKQHSVPIIVGGTADELTSIPGYRPDLGTTTEYRVWVRERFGDLADRVLAHYPANADEEVPIALTRLETDRGVIAAAHFLAGAMTKNGVAAYLYVITYAYPGPGGEELGAFHGIDAAFLRGEFLVPVPEREVGLPGLICDYWVQFARTGDPNREGLPDWPRFDNDTRPYMDFASDSRAGKGYKSESISLFTEMLDRQLGR